MVLLGPWNSSFSILKNHQHFLIFWNFQNRFWSDWSAKIHQNVFQMNSKHHFGVRNDQKTTKFHFLEPKMTKKCSKKSKIQTFACDPSRRLKNLDFSQNALVFCSKKRSFWLFGGPKGNLGSIFTQFGAFWSLRWSKLDPEIFKSRFAKRLSWTGDGSSIRAKSSGVSYSSRHVIFCLLWKRIQNIQKQTENGAPWLIPCWLRTSKLSDF